MTAVLRRDSQNKEKKSKVNQLIYKLEIRQQLETWFIKSHTIYDEEFDPGSGWTLAAGLTHASRGV